MQIARMLLGGCGIAGLLLAAFWSARLAYADWLASQNSVASLQRAVRLVPANAQYRIWLADLLELEGGDARPLLETATQLNPVSASAWIQLGLRAEIAGDLERAEKYLLQAREVSRQYAPRWTLANYYFRRRNSEAFWQWTRAALETGFPDPMPLFRLCWALTDDPDLILRRAIPNQRAVLVNYIVYLLIENRIAEAAPVAFALLAEIAPGDEQILLDLCEKLLAAGRPGAALRIWNSLADRGTIPYEPLRPEQGKSLTNGRFDARPASRGFDWHLRAAPGLGIEVDEHAGVLQIVFSGEQPEASELLAQWVPLQPGRRYRLAFEFQTSEIAPGSGLLWRVQDTARKVELLDEADLSGTGWTRRELEFSTPEQTELARVALRYERRAGTPRIKGSLSVRNVTLGFSQ